MRRALAALAMVSALIAPALAEAPKRQEILGFTLGQRAPEFTEVGNLQNLLGQEIARDMTGLMMVEQPNPRYQIALKNGRRLTLWFDASKEERPIYWIQLRESYEAPIPIDEFDGMASELDRPDYRVEGATGVGLLLIKIDPSVSNDRKDRIKRYIDGVIATRVEPTVPDDPLIELQDDFGNRLEILGDAFRGQIVAIQFRSNVIIRSDSELIDSSLAPDDLRKPLQ
jgi:hypothetical protein